MGDELLVAVAERLTAVLRPGDSLARLSGDEFVVLCEDLDDPAEAEAIAARFDDALTRPFILSRREAELHGQHRYRLHRPRRGGRRSELIHDADLAMYRSKRRRSEPTTRCSICASCTSVEHQAGLAQGLSGAAERGEFDVAYQPIVGCRSTAG